MGERRTLKGALIATVAGLVIAVATGEIMLRIAMPHWREFYSGWFMERRDVPGYGAVTMGRPGFDGYFAQNNGDFRARITLNGQGLRNAEPVTGADNRIWIVGDSMAFGWGVERDEMYSTVLSREAKLATYNVASPGTDICGYQALLAQMPRTVKPRAVVVGLILENDVRIYDCPRGKLKKRPAPGSDAGNGPSFIHIKYVLTRNSALYNFFAVSLKRVDVVNELLIRLGLVEREHKVRNRPNSDQIEALAQSTVAELGAVRALLPAGTPFAVLIAPARWEVKNKDPAYRKLRQAIAERLSAQGIEPIDPFTAFVETGFGPTHFKHDGHWSPLGHEIAAKQVAQWVRQAVN